MKRTLARMAAVGLVVGLLTLTLGSFAQASNAYDFGGQTVRFGMRNANATPFAPRGEYNWLQPEGELLAFIESIEKQFNCKLEFVNATDRGWVRYVSNFAANIVTGDCGADVVLVPSGTLPLLVREGALMRLDGILDDYYYDNYAPQPYAGNSILGNTYRIGGGTWYQVQLLIYNKNLFEREGLPNPYELWKADQWTWEEFSRIAHKATRDTNGDGEIDQWGLASYMGNSWGQYLGFGVSNNAAVTKDVDGHVRFAFDQAEALETLEFMQKLSQDQVLKHGDDKNLFTSDRIAMMQIFAGHLVDMKDTEFGVIPYPKGPRADGYRVWAASDHGYGIPVTTKLDPRALVELTHAIYVNGHQGNPHDPGFTQGPYVTSDPIETWIENMSMLVYDYESLDVLQWAVSRGEILDNMNLINELTKGDFFAKGLAVITQGESPSATMSALKPVVDALLDDVYRVN